MVCVAWLNTANGCGWGEGWLGRGLAGEKEGWGEGQADGEKVGPMGSLAPPGVGRTAESGPGEEWQEGERERGGKGKRGRGEREGKGKRGRGGG